MSAEKSALVLGIRCREAAALVKQLGYSWKAVRSWKQLLQVKELEVARVVLVRLSRETTETLQEVVKSAFEKNPLVDLVFWSPGASSQQVREWMRLGVADVLLETDPDSVATSLERVLREQSSLARMQSIRHEGVEKAIFEGLRSRSPRMWQLFSLCGRVAPASANILISGETGTGKELLAQAIHRRSGLQGEFVTINCGAIPEELIDSVLFGHVRGAFTGAYEDRKGVFVQANHGTLFLDEIGTISLEAQHRLLRVLQEGRVRPVGASEELEVNVRVISATNTPLETLMAQGRFREDLYYRINVIHMIVPSLRERKEDILFLFSYFLRKLSVEYEMTPPRMEEPFFNRLLHYEWPGNVRQLENVAERLLLTCQRGEILTEDDFSRLLQSFEGKNEFGVEWSPEPEPPEQRVPDQLSPPPPQADVSQEYELFSLDETLEVNLQRCVERVERAYLDACLRRFEGRMERTAHHMGISRRTLLRKMKKYGMDKKDYRYLWKEV